MPIVHSLGAVMGACLCVKEFALDAFSTQVVSPTSNLISTFSVSFVAQLLTRCLLPLTAISAVIQDMKLGQQTR